MEPISTALTHVQGENANKLSQGIFKMVNAKYFRVQEII